MKEGSKSTVIAVIAVAVLAVGGLGAWALWGNNDTTTTETAETQPAEEAAPSQTLVDIASGDEQFSTLVTAIQTAGLVDTLNGDGPFTVFAPTNAAFEKLPAATLEDLLSKPEELAKILTYHVVSGDVKAADVVKLTEADTVNGKKVNISLDGEIVKINNAMVTATDIAASNGTIHVIDTVLLP